MSPPPINLVGLHQGPTKKEDAFNPMFSWLLLRDGVVVARV